jgi:AcrR family transcriptional regulator
MSDHRSQTLDAGNRPTDARKRMQQALLTLTVEKGFSNISVRDITERARVNRSTFYRHYLDKYALLDETMDEVYSWISEEQFLAEKQKQIPVEIPSGLVCLLRHVQQFADFYRIMLGPQGDSHFIQRFRQQTETRFRALLALQGDDPASPSVELRLNSVSCAGISVLLWWLESGQTWTPEALAVWIAQLSAASIGFPASLDTA